MNGLRIFFRSLLFFAITVFTSYGAYAQCNQLSIEIGNNDEIGCAPHSVDFKVINNSGKTITDYLWTFGNGSSVQPAPTRTFDRGTWKPSVEVTFSDGTTCNIIYGGDIRVFGSPTAAINFPQDSIQCFFGNKFCFTESSTISIDGAPIKEYVWTFGDGEDTTVTQSGQQICHTYDYPGTYAISLTVIDTNGCTGFMKRSFSIVVLADLAPKFKVNLQKFCDSTVATFTNQTDSNGTHLVEWEWDFGDGSPKNSTAWQTIKHVYKGDTGTYNPSLRLKNVLGCADTFICKGCADYHKPKLELNVPDTVCWAQAKGGLEFEAQPIADAAQWVWVFDDPPSGTQNFAFYQWKASHDFMSGPKNYSITFTVIHPTCGVMDTCIVLHVMGPQAKINITPPPPVNNYVGPQKMTAADFYSSLDPCKGIDEVPYFVWNKIVPPQKDTVFTYCNAPVIDSVVDTIAYCDGDIQYPVTKIYQPTGYRVETTDSAVVPASEPWKFGQPIPTNAYTPPTGVLDWQTMHDSNLYTCEMPNLVKFTNNSVKYRLYQAMDNTPPGTFVDSCLHPNYPYASDSMTFLWVFSDPCGVPCTSSVNNPNYNCNFSILNAPYHYYSCTTAPASGCQSVTLVVWDTIMGKEIDHIDSTLLPTGEYDYDTVVTMTKEWYCQDTATLILKQGPPNAWWDKNAFNTMNWDLQKIVPKGQPGDPTKPLIGFIAEGGKACAGVDYHFRINFEQTIPTCEGQTWWLIWDWDSAVKQKPCPGNPSQTFQDIPWDGVYQDGTPAVYADGWPIAGPQKLWTGPPFFGEYWYPDDQQGPKTIGVKVQNGNCVSIAKYDAYFLFKKLTPFFNVHNVLSTGKNYVGNNATAQIGRVCHGGNPNNEVAGVTIELTPFDKDMEQVTRFVYNVARSEWPGGDYYYERPFWPDTATLDIFTEATDSVKSVKEYYYVPADSTIETDLFDAKGNKITSIYVFDVPLTLSEYNTLVNSGQVDIPINDFRGRKFSFAPGNFITLRKAPAGKPLITKDTIATLDLVSPNAAVQFDLPYPGFYTITSFTENLEKCIKGDDYYLIYGHFARFNITGEDADSIICVGEELEFEHLIRYWTTICPPIGGFFPDACINGVIPGQFAPYKATLTPWDVPNPTQHRIDLMPDDPNGVPYKWSNKGGYQPEKFEWNFGDDANGDGNRNTLGTYPTGDYEYFVGGSTIKHTYNKPGIFDVTLKTTDSSGCTIYTRRHNFIKVIGIVADFNVIGDTFKTCPPHLITYLDSSHFLGSELSDPKKFGYKDKVRKLVVSDSVLVDTTINGNDTQVYRYIKTYAIVDTTYVLDSIKTYTWDPGNGDEPVTKVDVDSMTFAYDQHGSYTVTLNIVTHQSTVPGGGCTGSKEKPDYIQIVSAEPEFEIISDTIGCTPFTVRIKNLSDIGDLYEWDFGDGTSISQTQFQEEIIHVYDSAGDFEITLREKKKIYNPLLGDTVECEEIYPTDNPIMVRVHPVGPLLSVGPDTVCIGNPALFTSTSEKKEYNNYQFFFGDGQEASVNATNGTAETSVVYTEEGEFMVIVLATTTIPGTDPAKTCQKFDTTYVRVIGKPEAKFELTGDTNSREIGVFSFNNISDNADQGEVIYTWNFGDNSPEVETKTNVGVSHTFIPSAASDVAEGESVVDNYVVWLYVENPSTGCRDSMSMPVNVEREWERFNVITPDGDGKNDVLDLTFKGGTDYELTIYNRWGEKVFESTGKDVDWNGNNNQTGGECPAGTYYYIWNFKLIGGIERSETGTVTLLR